MPKRKSYYQVHVNKRPKKAKYSKPYTIVQLKKMAECMALFSRMAEKLKASITHINFDNFKKQ